MDLTAVKFAALKFYWDKLEAEDHTGCRPTWIGQGSRLLLFVFVWFVIGVAAESPLKTI